MAARSISSTFVRLAAGKPRSRPMGGRKGDFMQTTKTNAGLEAGDFFPGVALGGLIGLLVGLKAGLLIGLVAGIAVGALITFFVYREKTARPQRQGGADGGSGDGGWDGGDCGGGDGGGGGD